MSDKTQLVARTISAAKWNYLGNGAKVVLQFLIGVLLARLLGPEAFGIVAIAWLMIGVGKLFSDFGFSAALIQRPDLTDRDVGFVFTVQIAIGATLSLTSYSLAGQIASFFNKPDASPVIEVMSWLFLIQAIGQTTTAVLSRALRFKFSQAANVATYLVGYVLIGVPAAYLGYGVWSLVAAQMVQAVAYMLVVLVRSGVSIKPAIRPSRAGLFKFGSKVIGANLCSYTILNLDSFVVGRLIGVAELGIYNRAMTLVTTPMNVVTTSLQSVLFSACSKAQDNKAQIAKAFLAAMEFIGFVCLPVFITVAAVSKTVVLGVYGAGWSMASEVVTPLALAMPVHALLAVIGPILMALNRAELELKAQFITLLIVVPLIWIAGYGNLALVGWAVLTAYVVRWGFLLREIKSELSISLAEIAGTLKRPVALAAAIAVPVFFIDRALSLQHSTAQLFVVVFAAFGLAVVLARMFGPWLVGGQLGALLLTKNLLPAWPKRWLRLGA